MPRKRMHTPSDYYSDFPSRLRRLIESADVTQEDVAKAIGKTRQAIGYYINGTSSPDWKVLVKIAQYFNVSIDYLCGLTDEPTRDVEIQKICNYTGLSGKAINNIVTIGKQEGRSDFVLPIRTILNDILEDEHFGSIIFAIAASIGKGSTNYIEHLSIEDQKEINEYLVSIEQSLKENFLDDFYISIGYEAKEHYVNEAKTLLGMIIDQIYYEYEASIDKPLGDMSIAECNVRIKKGLLEEKELINYLMGKKPLYHSIIVKNDFSEKDNGDKT